MRFPYTPEQRAARFWSRVDRRGPDECWPWLRSRDADGYGQVWDGSHMLKTHRYAWILSNGPIPDDLCVCHRCDNPPCCNPAHLFMGTQADNVADRDAKGHHVNVWKGKSAPHSVGERNVRAKLTAEMVVAIRLSTERRKVLAEKYGVSLHTIIRVRSGENWSHIPSPRSHGAIAGPAPIRYNRQ